MHLHSNPRSGWIGPREVEEARSRYRLSDIIGRHTKLKRVGRELGGLCLWHNERTPSLRVNDARGTYYCFGCGAHGDAISAVQHIEGLGFLEAVRWLLDIADLPMISEADRVKAAAEEAADRARAIHDAREQWFASGRIAGTPGECYFRTRGIWAPIPRSLRFGLLSPYRHMDSDEWAPPRPAAVGVVTDVEGKLTAVQRIFIKPDGSGKAEMRKPKITLGRMMGSALRLGPSAPEIILCEGPEDGLSLMQQIPDTEITPAGAKASVWCALGTANMAAVQFPSVVKQVTLAGDNNEAGRAAVDAAAESIWMRGLTVKTMFPDPEYKDWNDQLRDITQ